MTTNSKLPTALLNGISQNVTDFDPYLLERQDNLEYIGLKKASNIAFYLQVIRFFNKSLKLIFFYVFRII